MEVNTKRDNLSDNLWEDKFGVLYSGKRLVDAKSLKTAEYIVKPGTEVICNKAFYRSIVECIVLPESLLAIGDAAFAFCVNLSSIILPDSITEIGKGVFVDTKLKEIVFPRELQKLGKLEYPGWSESLEKLRKLDFSKVTKLKAIPENFIGFIPRIKEIAFPNGVEIIEGDIGGENMGRIFLPPTIKEIEYLNMADTDIYCYSPSIEELEPLVEAIYDNCDEDEYEEYTIRLHVLPEYLDSYKSQRDAEGISSKILVIDVMPEEFRYYYDN